MERRLNPVGRLPSYRLMNAHDCTGSSLIKVQESYFHQGRLEIVYSSRVLRHATIHIERGTADHMQDIKYVRRKGGTLMLEDR
jgi:hypothetical protein